ncbi:MULTISPECIES: adenylosuccinate lyase [Porcipelethomonas]|uniref:adenylosuccinate lyase n=1 Tax=Porcipelethomonas TaxID=2981643 RepID=UPI0008230BC1|nr:adenylosuccinate lyase [Porcipelethomonas ammoniilytica]MCU6719262.1 adenylosuccinate lyase [Porcipelethomonas ammoniilytica]SCI74795.1 Adenylosuccinate lyase [uncultured Ruminococcus sp.]
MSNTNSYESPFCTRYASEEMQYIFSADKKFTTWRRLWVALARAEMKLGLPVTEAQVKQLEENINNIDYDMAAAREKEVRHDVMAHVYTYGQACPDAKGIIHLGATSCYVGDNTDVIIMRDALQVIRRKLINVIAQLSDFAMKYKDMPALAYTHLQPAQLTTVGKRATLWTNELLMDLKEIERRISDLQLLGSKGTTGTQASFMELFEGDTDKIKQLEKMIAEEMGFESCVPVSGQTYSRKVDSFVVNALAGIAQSCSKFSNDMRILQSFKEMEEPFEKSQIGSSAMAYKRNPMRSERITSLSRYLMVDVLNPAFTAGTQWFERTLDDSANKRISVAEAFLAADAILNIMINVTSGMVVYPKIVRKRVMAELPFMATENIMMDAVKKGGDRQALHEKIRQYSMEAGKKVKEEGLENDLCERILADPMFMITKEEMDAIMAPENFTGRSAQQVEEFVSELVQPILEANKDILNETFEMKN